MFLSKQEMSFAISLASNQHFACWVNETISKFFVVDFFKRSSLSEVFMLKQSEEIYKSIHDTHVYHSHCSANFLLNKSKQKNVFKIELLPSINVESNKLFEHFYFINENRRISVLEKSWTFVCNSL